MLLNLTYKTVKSTASWEVHIQGTGAICPSAFHYWTQISLLFDYGTKL